MRQARTPERMEWRRDTEGSPVARLELLQLPRGALAQRGAAPALDQTRQLRLELFAPTLLPVHVDQAVGHRNLEMGLVAQPAYREKLLFRSSEVSQVALE